MYVALLIIVIFILNEYKINPDFGFNFIFMNQCCIFIFEHLSFGVLLAIQMGEILMLFGWLDVIVLAYLKAFV